MSPLKSLKQYVFLNIYFPLYFSKLFLSLFYSFYLLIYSSIFRPYFRFVRSPSVCYELSYLSYLLGHKLYLSYFNFKLYFRVSRLSHNSHLFYTFSKLLFFQNLLHSKLNMFPLFHPYYPFLPYPFS